MAYNGKNREIWQKWPALMIPYLHDHGEDPSHQRCYRYKGLRSQYMPLGTLMVASSYFLLGGKTTHIWGRMATYPKLGDSQFSLQEERPHGETPHSMRVCMPSPNRPTVGQVAHATSGVKSGEEGVCGRSGQNGQNSPKSGHSKNRISVSQDKEASGFCMDANRSVASLLQQELRFKA